MLSHQMLYIVFTVFSLIFSNFLFPQPVIFPDPLSPRIANYDIDVKLDAERRLLYGKEVLNWRNTTNEPVNELQFHLYLNAFRNNKSTFMIESGGRHRDFKIGKKGGWGFIEIDRIYQLPGEELNGLDVVKMSIAGLKENFMLIDLEDSMEFIQPDDGNEYDKTVLRVLLPEPVPPGGTTNIYFRFRSKLPRPPFARTGAMKEYFFIGQWFPKIGVLTDEGWNCHQFHAHSEFFADFGVYNVLITVPQENIVGATGLEVGVTQNEDSTATHFYHAEDVHDFAWTTSPEFVEFKGRAQDVDVRVLMQPDHAEQGQRHLDAAILAINYFQNWYGDYPFPNLTVVDPRRKAGGSGGMEYPTLITSLTKHNMPRGIRIVEDVIIHEFGHNYWYHLLASNEFEESWMDEGINTYTEIQIMDDAYGPVGDMIDFLGIRINDLQLQRAQYIFLPRADITVRRAWEYYSGGSYGVNSYAKPGLLLTTLQNYLSRDTMLKIMRTYVERWRFKHPVSQDFIDIANEVSGQDLNWFFDQALFSNKVLDYSVTKVVSEKVKPEKGYDFSYSASVKNNSSKENSADSLRPDSASAGNLTPNEENNGDSMYYTEVKVRRLGDFRFPVELLMVFENGEKIREQWDGQDLWRKYTYIKPTRLKYATVDPEQKIPLDVNYTNNSRAVKRRNLGAGKLSLSGLFSAQFLMDQPDFLSLLYRITKL